MKLFISLFSFFLISYSICAQEYDFSGLQGLRDQEGNIFFEISGYDITVSSHKGTINDSKTINAIQKKYSLENITATYPDAQILTSNLVMEGEYTLTEGSDINIYQICYLLQTTEKELTTILLQIVEQRDIILEQEFIIAYLKGSLNNYINDFWTVSSFSFAGRTIHMNSICEWVGPHNIYCEGGQISWSEFSDPVSANLFIDAQVEVNNNSGASILSEEDIEVIFEDIPTWAYRVSYLNEGEGHPLIVYYIVQEVRGKFIGCVLSNYGYNHNDYALTPLLEQVMNIPKLPDWAYNHTDSDEEKVDVKEDKINYNISLWEIRAGAFFPIGNLSNIFGPAPSIGTYIGLPINQNFALDLGFHFAFPTNTKSFSFYNNKTEYSTEINAFLNLNLRIRYQKEIERNTYFTPYFGFGIVALRTDLEKEVYSRDEDSHYTIETINPFIGCMIRYQKVGFFVEYHYMPYSIAGKVRESFGNSAFNGGILIAF